MRGIQLRWGVAELAIYVEVGVVFGDSDFKGGRD